MRDDHGNHLRDYTAEGDHAGRGAETLRLYVDRFDHGLDLKIPEDYQAATADLIADLLHAGHEIEGFDPDDALASGQMHFEAELRGDGS